jgi:hypothetical protein
LERGGDFPRKTGKSNRRYFAPYLLDKRSEPGYSYYALFWGAYIKGIALFADNMKGYMHSVNVFQMATRPFD